MKRKNLNQIKRYKIIPDGSPGKFRVIDKLKDDFVCVPLVCDSEDALIEIMGTSMDETIDPNKVHPDYLKDETP